MNVVPILDGDTLGHVIDLVDTNKTSGELEHVVPQGNDDKLGVLGSFLDVIRYDRNLHYTVSRITI